MAGKKLEPDTVKNEGANVGARVGSAEGSAVAGTVGENVGSNVDESRSARVDTPYPVQALHVAMVWRTTKPDDQKRFIESSESGTGVEGASKEVEAIFFSFVSFVVTNETPPEGTVSKYNVIR